MSADEQADAIIRGLYEAGVEFVVVGGMAAVLQRAPIRVLGLSRLIAVKAKAGRPKDRAVLPVLVATLDEQRRSKQ